MLEDTEVFDDDMVFRYSVFDVTCDIKRDGLLRVIFDFDQEK